jgi:hypothetical protein
MLRKRTGSSVSGKGHDFHRLRKKSFDSVGGSPDLEAPTWKPLTLVEAPDVSRGEQGPAADLAAESISKLPCASALARETAPG